MKTGEIRLGQHLIQKRLCTLRQVNEALGTQRDLRGQGMIRHLGWILIQKGFLEEVDILESLADLGVLELCCSTCDEVHAIISYQRGTEYRCPRCRTLLVLEDRPRRDGGVKNINPVPVPEGAPAPGGKDEDPFLMKVIGGCQILERIARGGMGVVYKARQLNLGRTVAIKILSEDLARDRVYVERFVQEARSAAGLNHASIILIIDVGEQSGTYYFIMEHVDGQNLRELLESQGVLDFRQALHISLQVSQALQHAHRRGIIHRDIKPENIMILREGGVKLADLGLAKRVDVGVGITHAGSILGTPFYMAPEQAKDFSQVDGRSDIYSLGVTLYRALTGQVPFDGRTPIEVMIKAIDGNRVPVRAHRPEIPVEVEAIVDRMMDKDPSRRFQTADEVVSVIQKYLHAIGSGRFTVSVATCMSGNSG